MFNLLSYSYRAGNLKSVLEKKSNILQCFPVCVAGLASQSNNVYFFVRKVGTPAPIQTL